MLLNGVRDSTKADRALPLDLRLRAIADKVPASSIEEVWVFPPLPDRQIASEFLVLVCYNGGGERRRILTCHVDAHFADPESEELHWVQRVREHGTAPQSWLSGMPDRLLKRLSDAGVPEILEIGGRGDAWEEAVTRLGNGNGNGDGERAALSPGAGLPHVDIRTKSGISFSTIIEFSVNGADTEPTG